MAVPNYGQVPSDDLLRTNPSEHSPSEEAVVDGEKYDSADNAHSCAVGTIDIDTGNAGAPGYVEQPASDHCSDDADHSINDSAFARIVNNFTCDHSHNETK